jgi:hypothetical protein
LVSLSCVYEAHAIGVAPFAVAVNPANSAGFSAFIDLIGNSAAVPDLTVDARLVSAALILRASHPLTPPPSEKAQGLRVRVGLTALLRRCRQKRGNPLPLLIRQIGRVRFVFFSISAIRPRFAWVPHPKLESRLKPTDNPFSNGLLALGGGGCRSSAASALWGRLSFYQGGDRWLPT